MGLEPPLIQMQQQWRRQKWQQPRPREGEGMAAASCPSSRMEEVSVWLGGHCSKSGCWGGGLIAA